jgi:hypothetical protein
VQYVISGSQTLHLFLALWWKVGRDGTKRRNEKKRKRKKEKMREEKMREKDEE